MRNSPVIWILILLALIIAAAVFLMMGKQSTTYTSATASSTASTTVPAAKLPLRNVRNIVQPGQPIGNDATTSTTTP